MVWQVKLFKFNYRIAKYVQRKTVNYDEEKFNNYILTVAFNDIYDLYRLKRRPSHSFISICETLS